MGEIFLERGMKVVLADVEAPALEAAVTELAKEGGEVVGVRCDVTSSASVEKLRDETLERFGAVHVLCNNAGVAGGGDGRATWEASPEDWDWVMGVNFDGVLHGIRHFVPAMIDQGGPGHVVNTASMAGLVHGMGIYGVSKHAVVALSESMWNELRQRNHPIGVSVLCPGWVRTRIMESERNRPETPRSDPGQRRPEAELMRRAVEQMIEQGMDPREIGRIVADAIEADRFYVLPHPQWKNVVENRMRRILDEQDPVGVPPEGGMGIEWPPSSE
jgi:NAD(P)-dependent dehydrogenase (short-subunit alcohol dehydrogenase family)